MRSCSEHTILHCVESYLYYIILENKYTIYIHCPFILYIYIYIIYEFFLPVSQRVEMNYIFSDNIRILYLSWYVKSPKETVKKRV